MKLHNFAIENDSLAIPEPNVIELQNQTTPADQSFQFQNEVDVDDVLNKRRRNIEALRLRKVFTEEIRDAGLRRSS
jgi:hypothetical protein